MSGGLYRTGPSSGRRAGSGLCRVVILHEVVAAHVRRLGALRRAGIVERVAEGLWKVPHDLPEQGRRYDAQRPGRRGRGTEMHLPIERQARVIGATWLDQQLIGGGSGLGDLGFGSEAKQAMQQRRLPGRTGAGRAARSKVILARNLLGTPASGIRGAQAAKDIAPKPAWSIARWPTGGVAGIYRRSVKLASGRYAMLDDGMGFSLVPWRPVIEQRLGTADRRDDQRRRCVLGWGDGVSIG